MRCCVVVNLATGYAPEAAPALPLTIPLPLSLLSVSIFQSALSVRQSRLLRSDHPHGLSAERPEAVTGELFWGYLRQGRGWFLVGARS